MSNRVSNWPGALHAYVEANKLRPFAWGEHDCILFACAGIAAITGHDPAAVWRGSYSTALGAARVFKLYGGFERMIETVAAANHYTEIAVTKAQRGDLVLHDGKWPTAGLCCGRLTAFAGPNHLIFTLTAECRRAWRIS